MVNLQAELTSVSAKINQLKGREAAALARLEQEFGFTTLEQAEEALLATKKEADAKQQEFDGLYAEFISKWGDYLESSK